jgi:predicted nucleic acid-binding protein
MILLDTNVISEPLRRTPNAGVVAWIDEQPIETLYLAAVTVAELRFGVASMPAGKRRDTLRERLEKQVMPLFIGRVLPFNVGAAQLYAERMAAAQALGLTIAPADGYIAATAAANGLLVATRDTSPFKAAGLDVINPWNPEHAESAMIRRQRAQTGVKDGC